MFAVQRDGRQSAHVGESQEGQEVGEKARFQRRHVKLVKRAVEEKIKERNGPAEPEQPEEVHGENAKEPSSVDPPTGLMGLAKDDPILSFISGMEDIKPHVSEKYLKKQEKRRLKEQQQDEKNKVVLEQQNRERDEEMAAINKQVEDKHLRVKVVAADGNCLYRAIAEQLAQTDAKMKSGSAYRIIRRKAANYLRDHADEFRFFLEDGVNYEAYCNQVEGSNGFGNCFGLSLEWGGQLELRALALALQRPIHVYSADSPVVVIGEDIQVRTHHGIHSRASRCTFPTTRSTSRWAITTTRSSLICNGVFVGAK